MFVCGPTVRTEVLALVEAGVNDCEISRRTGIPRTTVRDMRAPTYVRKTKAVICPRCHRPGRQLTFSAADYCELLGLYLGDGHITQMERTQRLRITLDTKYPTIVAEALELLRRCFPNNSVGSHPQHGGTCIVVWVYCSHLSCLFPQHGEGLKHERAIVLEPWQQRLVALEPWPLIRGLIRSDGCSFVNRTGPYEYPSYAFSNCSEGVVEIFSMACRAVGLKLRTTFTPGRRIWHVRINRRECVALLDEHVGKKA